jgi:hypothetical protein
MPGGIFIVTIVLVVVFTIFVAILDATCRGVDRVDRYESSTTLPEYGGRRR